MEGTFIVVRLLSHQIFQFYYFQADFGVFSCGYVMLSFDAWDVLD